MKHCITILSILLSGWLWGQNCPLEASLPIPVNDSAVYSFEVFDVINNNLAAPGQGVCGVQMRFRHNSITDFEVWLKSPNGKEIQLIGPNATVSPPTLGGSWNVTFARCLGTPMPQVPFAPRWNNSTNPFGATGITGSYWPFLGCLEEFNTGPVNGTWELKLKTITSTQIRGSLLGLDIQFCDKRGQRCCFADAGVLSGPFNVAACQADFDLNLTTAPTYSGAKPDSSKYAYTYAIGRDMILQGFDSIPDLRRMSPGNYQVCGLSYLRKDTSLFPAANNILRLDTLRNQLKNATIALCGEMTADCINVLIAPRSDSTVLPIEIICAGDSVVVAGQIFKTTGRFPITFNQPGRCDSLVIVNVRVEQSLNSTLDSIICAGDSVAVGTKQYKVTGNYVDTLQASSGCDSIVSLRLVVLPAIPVKDTAIEICSGRSVVIGGQRFSDSGVYDIPLVSSQGCDSLIRLTLTIIEPQSVITATDTFLTCTRTQVVLDGTQSTPLGQVMYRWEDNMGNPIGDSTHFVVTSPNTYYLQVITTKSLCARRVRIIITADTLKPVVNIGGTDTLDCNTPRITLNSTGSTNLAAPLYNWTTTGTGRIEGLSTQANVLVSGPGFYQLTVTNNRNGCTDSAEVQVFQDLNLPIANAGTSDTLTCSQGSVNLNGSASSTGASFRYLWTGLNGQVVADSTSVQTSTQVAGLYQLAVTNTFNQCVSFDTVNVVADTTPVSLSIDPPRELNCTTRSITLTSRANPSNRSLSYNWVAINGGNITSANNTANIEVDLAGLYALEVTDLANGCTTEAEITVKDSSNTVSAVIAVPLAISCTQPETELDGSGSQGGSTVVFQWSTTNGNIIGANNHARIRVGAAGTYQLIVRDTTTQCSDTSTVVVSSQQIPPIARAGQDLELTCSAPIATLSAQGSATGNNIRYRWQGPCPITDSSAANISTTCEGQYVLQVLDTSTGCTSTDTVVVSLNSASPNAQVATTTTNINCTAGEGILSARGSSGGQIRWFFQSNEVGRDTQLLVRNAGVYLLVVENTALGCTDSVQVQVNKDCKPIASIAPVAGISCKQEIVTLDGTGSTFNASIRYHWLGPVGDCIVSDSLLPSIDVKCPGTYQLVVENLATNEQDTASIVVTANQVIPSIAIAPVDTLTCTSPSLVLNGSGSAQGNNIQYTWLNNTGQVVGKTAQVSINAPGLYAFEVLDTLNGCFAQREVLVVQDTNIPQIAFNSSTFPCNRDTFNFRATVLPIGRNYQLNWMGPGIAGRVDSTVVALTAAGQYIFSATDLGSNCTVRDTINLVEPADCLPCISASSSTVELTCTQTQIALPAAFCRPCVGCTVNWSTNDGNFVSRADTLTPIINRAGTYTLTVLDSSARAVTLNIIVRSDQQLPVLPSGFDASLTCAIREIALPNPDSSALNPVSWRWETSDGQLVADTLPGRLKAVRIGTYRLVGRNVLTNCESFTLVRIGLDSLAPRAFAGSDQVLDCTNQRLTLNGNGSAVGPGISYLWTALDNGRILAGENSANPVIDAQGRYVIKVEDARNNCFSTDTLLVTPDATLPRIEPITNQLLNCRDSILTLNGNMPAGGPYTANWCALGNARDTIGCFAQQNLQVSSPGLYSYELTDTRNNCRNRIFVTVKDDRIAPSIDAGLTDTLRCNALNLRLNGQNLRPEDPLLFAWRGDDNQAIEADSTLNPLLISGGWYTLLAQSRRNFCTSTDRVFIAVDLGRPQVSAGRDTFLNCVPLQISLQGNFSSSGGEPVEARWTANRGRIISGQNTANAQVDQPGNYLLTVRNTVNNCIAMDEVVVSNEALKPQARIAGPNTISCNVQQVTLLGTASTNPFNRTLRYFWTPVDGGRIIGSPADDSMVTARAGLYRLIVTDALSGCQDSSDFSLQADLNRPRIAIATPATLSCSRPQVRIDASESATGVIYLYTWLAPNGQTLPDSNRTPQVTLPGNYQLSVRNVQSGCISVDSVEVTEDYTLPQIRLRALDVLDCVTPVIELEAGTSQGRNLSFQWSASHAGILSNTAAALIRINAPGYYRLVLTDGLSGCSSRDSLLVQEAASAIDTVIFAVQQPGCGSNQAGQVSVTNISGGTAPYKVFLNNTFPEANNLFRNLRPGNYTLKVEDAGGCLWTAPIELQAPQAPSVELGPDREIKLGDSVSLAPIISNDSIVSITWTAGTTLSDPNSRNQLLKPSNSTTAQISIRAANGCTASDFVNIRVIRESPLFVPNIFSPNGDGINDVLNIFAGSQVNKVKFFRIYDRWGNQVYGLQEFSPNDTLLGWDGKLGGTLLNSAVFTWYAEVEMADGKVEGLKGDVSLLR